jgi:DNA-binding response OmpR family regulator
MKTKILLVEDDEAVHCALSEVLQGEGYEILHAFGSADALRATHVHRDVALVLLDLDLGGENGWDTFERLTSENPTLPIIIITACSDQRARAEEAGAGALMEKPLNIVQLLEAIQRLIAERLAGPMARIASHASPAFCFPSNKKFPAS